MGSQQELNQVAEALIKKWEGLHKVKSDGRVYPYLCPANVWTIGYGSTRDENGRPVTESTPPITPLQAEALMRRDMIVALAGVLRYCPNAINYDSKLGALISFVQNLGAGRLKASTLRQAVLKEDWVWAKKEIQKWVWGGGKKLPGLVARRAEEASYL